MLVLGDVLPKENLYSDPIADGWGETIGYEIEPGGVIALTSFGKDQQPGGEGKNRDIILRYRIKNPDGSFNVNDPDWLMFGKITDTFRD